MKVKKNQKSTQINTLEQEREHHRQKENKFLKTQRQKDSNWWKNQGKGSHNPKHAQKAAGEAAATFCNRKKKNHSFRHSKGRLLLSAMC